MVEIRCHSCGPPGNPGRRESLAGAVDSPARFGRWFGAMAKKKVLGEQQTLFGEVQMRSLAVGKRKRPTQSKTAPAPEDATAAERRQWSMPAPSGSTIAEVRLRWNKRLTPAQVARVEAELGALPRLLGNLGFGAVLVERAFVRRRQKG